MNIDPRTTFSLEEIGTHMGRLFPGREVIFLGVMEDGTVMRVSNLEFSDSLELLKEYIQKVEESGFFQVSPGGFNA